MLPWIQSDDESRMSQDGADFGWAHQFQQYLNNFVQQNRNLTIVDDMNIEQKQELTKDVVAYWVLDELNDKHLSTALNVLLIFSRDKANMEFMAKATILEPLQRVAALEVGQLKFNKPESVLMAMKTICNLIYQCPAVQKFYEVSGVAERAMDRIVNPPEMSNNDIRFFELRIIFLLTALSVDVRGRLRHRMNAVKVLNDIIVDVLISGDFMKATLTEVFKILFNITVAIRNLEGDMEAKEDDHDALVVLTRTLQRVLVSEKEIDHDVTGHVANVLNNMPVVCYGELIINHQIEYASQKSERDIGASPHVLINPAALISPHVAASFDFTAIDTLIDLLKDTLTGNELDSTTITQATSHSILHLFYMLCRFNPTIRKYVRSIILPPMTDEVRHLPTEGDTIRNILVRAMSCTDIELKTLASNLLYILCKENGLCTYLLILRKILLLNQVSRLIKYTGFGNSAGLLADLGLLSATKAHRRLSSDSEDSETEVYKQLAPNVNPVTGRFEKQTNVTDCMSEEQKEYEAMQLVNQLNKLNREGIIVPAKVGPDGRPQAVEHVLQLQQEDETMDAEIEQEE